MPQATTYYCGPATAYEVLAYQMINNGLGSTTGPRGEALTQGNLANTNYLWTDYYGGTNWSPYVMGPTLNAWTRSSFYAAVNGSGVGGGFNWYTWESSLYSDINGGWAIAGNTVENAGTNNPHLVGHPSSLTIYHWIAIWGYWNSADYTLYADSVAGTSFWWWSANVPATSSFSSVDMTTLLNGRGYVW